MNGKNLASCTSLSADRPICLCLSHAMSVFAARWSIFITFVHRMLLVSALILRRPSASWVQKVETLTLSDRQLQISDRGDYGR